MNWRAYAVCVNQKVYGYDCPHPMHYPQRPGKPLLTEWDRDLGTTGTPLTKEVIDRAMNEIWKAGHAP